ncbi:MAG: MBL fold metallo-hydrolase, partial [Flavobacteriaceae bacterium]
AQLAPGLLWARLPIPYPQNEVNVYFLDGQDGWTVVDTGMHADITREVWQALLSGPLKGYSFDRILVTHHHPDHIGLADWLSDRLGATAWATAGTLQAFETDTTEYGPDALAAVDRFCAAHALNDDAAYALKRQPNAFLSRVRVDVSRLRTLPLDKPLTFSIGTFDLMVAEGHAAGQFLMRDRAGRFFFSSDQILPGVVSKLAFNPLDPSADTAGTYVASLDDIEAWVDETALILPGHFAPFRGLRARLAEIRERQARRGNRLMKAFADGPVPAGRLLGALSGREPKGRDIAFALAETFANINLLIAQERLEWRERGGQMILVPR